MLVEDYRYWGLLRLLFVQWKEKYCQSMSAEVSIHLNMKDKTRKYSMMWNRRLWSRERKEVGYQVSRLS
jgi:hypothetical protein